MRLSITVISRAIIFALFLFIVSCGYRQITKVDIPDTEKEGIIVAGTYHNAWHSLLYLTSGISAVIDKGKELEIPWGESAFIPTQAGKHEFEIWSNWFGKSGLAKGCFELESGQIVYMEYMPPTWTRYEEGKVTITDQNKHLPIAYKKDCLK